MKRERKTTLGRREFLRTLGAGATVAAADHVEGARAHPLETGRIDEDVELVLDTVMNDAALVNLLHAQGRTIDEMNVG